MSSNLLRRLAVGRGSPGRSRVRRRGAGPGSASSLGILLLGLLSAALAGPAWSVGLGEIELDSALNERLDAEIELLDASGLQPSEIVVSLGSAEDFRRVGVERFFFLTDLRFEVDYAGGGAVVKVTSGQPITEPYLNFLIEVLWPNGRLLKEFTLLLDPPTFSQAAAPVVQRPALSAAPSQSAGRVERAPSRPGPSPAPRPQPARSSGTQVQLDSGAATGPSPLDEGIVDGEFRMTDRNDTLWDIASATLPGGGITVQQNMLALQRLNPEAFIGGNINLLKAGYVLRLPSEAQARSLTAAAANQEVAQQNEAWRSGVPTATSVAATDSAAPQGSGGSEDLRPQLDASSRGGAPAASTATPDGELRIVAGAGDSATGQGGPDSEALNAALEEQDRLTREVDELTYQLDREKELAANQIEVKERQLEVKDQQIAELQAQLEQLRAQGPVAASPSQANQTQTASRQVAESPWWQSPYLMYGGAGVLVLLLVGGMVASRRRRSDADDEFYADDAVAGAAFDERDAGAGRVEPGFAEAELGDTAARQQDTLLDDEDLATDDEILALDDDDRASTAVDSEEAAPRSSETGDVIGEADIYIAYGRYPQAIGLLLGVLESSPERNDVRLKLLEVYADVKDREGFDTHLAKLVEYCDDEDALLTARELESSFGDEDTGSAADDDDARASNIDFEPTATAAVDELETLTLDDEGGIDEDFTQAAASAGVEAAADDSDSALDFELELDELETSSGADAGRFEDSDAGAGDELGGDLGMNFDPDRDVDESLEEEADSATGPIDLDTEELSLDDVLDDDAGAEFEAESSSEVATAQEDEFEFDEEGDSASTKLDLARAYIDMGDADGARDILQEVVGEGTSEQRQQAQALLDSI